MHVIPRISLTLFFALGTLGACKRNGQQAHDTAAIDNRLTGAASPSRDAADQALASRIAFDPLRGGSEIGLLSDAGKR